MQTQLSPSLRAEIRRYMELHEVDYATAARDVRDAQFEGYVTDGGTEHGYAIYSNVVLG
jgi:hypothetical protein